MQLGFISNQRTSAIIQGTSIVWFPVPKFDSPSIFTKLLDEDGGEFSILLPEKIESIKQYYEHPLVLTTGVKTERGGSLKVTDLLPLGETVIIRKVESDVPFTVVFKPAFKYALYRPIILRDRFVNSKGRDCVGFLYKWDGKVRREGSFTWRFSEGKGFLVANYATDKEHGVFSERGKALQMDFEKPFEKTIKYWESFDVKSKVYEDLYRSSVYVLLGSIYSPSGASIAAPTTSLPEVVGGSRNWDYRFAWVRDSSITAEALINAGFIIEARRILNFLLSLVNFTSKPFYYPLYTVEGTIPPPEVKLRWLSGYKNSKPVRIGNAASKQIQLDVEGFFMNALYKYFEKTGDTVLIKDVFDKVEHIADWISENWLMKDSGIWEDRGEPKHYTHSKIMMWVALDRAGKLAEYIGKEDRWKESKEKIRKWVLENCVSNGYLTRLAGSEDVDSALLSAPLYGFIDVKDELFLNTLKVIEKELKVGNFVKRYKTDFMGEAKHPFLLTSIWLARVYVRLGRENEAEDLTKELDKIAGSLHLVGEHLDVEKKEFTGNFPQVFVHAEIVNLVKEIEGLHSKS